MEIKVLNKLGDVECKPINDRFILLIEKCDDTVCDNIFTEKFYMIDTDNYRRYEIAGDVVKVLSDNISYATDNRNYVVFSTAETVSDGKMTITYYIYFVEDKSLKQMHSISVDIDTFKKSEFIKAFVLDESHLLIQTEKRNYRDGSITYLQLLYDVSSKTLTQIKVPILVNNGIMDIQPVSGDKCLIKLGRPVLVESVDQKTIPDGYEEYLGVVHVNRFISEITVNVGECPMDIIDKRNSASTIMYVKCDKKNIFFTVYYIKEGRLEIVIYNLESKSKTIRYDASLVRMQDLLDLFVIDGVPYEVSYSRSKKSRIINLNTQKEVAKLYEGEKIACIANGLVVISRQYKGKLFNQEVGYINIYEFDKIEKEAIVRLKENYCGYFIKGEDLLLLTR